ncbi:Fe-S cluster assembly protein HesB [Jeotgalibacillus sp. S-D1]|uniref:3-hexulose-6-phosphate synthase n=1 Tax=Jeotgalibacillus sp. S-D1 TaxID=2552189 RepID=UPI00105A51C7|nr:3-hexulose-6-phosphate synthase [Jeotgalibacillus sp. S-D1]TDL30897.1 Fe-S cluster assembly protein HesB [Jeotgalibacillus sp. S-D1]
MKLQLALDRLTREQCFELIDETRESVDWIEVGTGVIKEYGMSIIREIKERYPDTILVADMKTCDAGSHEAAQAFEAGADISTVMAFSANRTISDALEAARKHNGRIMIDLLGVTDQQRIQEIVSLGVNLVSLHYGKDMQKDGEMGTNLFDLVNEIPSLELSVAGGLNLESLPAMLKKSPNILIIGSAITKSADSRKAAEKMKGMIQSYEINH